MKIRVADGIVILGKRGSGKTTLLKFLIKELSPAVKFFIIDIVGNLREFSTYQNVRYLFCSQYELEKIYAFLEEALRNAPCMVVIDEADRIYYPMGSAGKKTPLSDLVNLWRNYGVGYMVSARRTANISKDYLANQNWAFVFRHTYPKDLEVLTEWFDLDKTKFTNLNQYEFIIFHDDKPVGISKIKA